MKKLTHILAFVIVSAMALAQHGVALRGKGTGDNIANVTIEAFRSGDNVRGQFSALVRTTTGELGVRGKVVRFSPDADHPHAFNFVAHCEDQNGVKYIVEGVCFDGNTSERDDVSFVIGVQSGPVFRGSTDRQVVTVRRIFR